MSEEMKVCRKCHLELPITKFVVVEKTTGKRDSQCRVCEAARVRAYYAANAEYRAKTKINSVGWAKANPVKAALQRRKTTLKRKYDLTHEQYDQLLAAQGGCCALCGVSEHGHKHNNGKTARLPGGFSANWPIDHSHLDGRVRGLLCHACNVRIGGYEVLLRMVGEEKLLDYLSRPSPILSLPIAMMPIVEPAPPPRYVAELPPRYTRGACSVEGCGEDQHAGNLCFRHYMRARRRDGDTGTVAPLPHAGSKLTDDDIRAIRASTSKGADVAAKYGISQPTVSMIRNRRIWTHVADDPTAPTLLDLIA
jgi:hypothetical protein